MNRRSILLLDLSLRQPKPIFCREHGTIEHGNDIQS